MEDEEDEGFIEVDEGPTSRKFRKADIAVLAVGLLSGIVDAFASAATTAYNLAAMHANYEVDRDAFREEAALEIETITGDSNDG